MSTIRPLPGKCIVRLEQNFKDIEGGIVVPGAARMPGFIGVVVAHNPKPTGDYRLLACRVQVERQYGQKFTGADGNTYLSVKEEYVQAVIAPEAKAELVPDAAEMPRCRTCKSAGEANILLDNAGFCVTCRKNAKGETAPHNLQVDRRAMKVTDADMERFRRMPSKVVPQFYKPKEERGDLQCEL